jgi:hypothetical protein
MVELAAEPEYRNRSTWERPITDTHTFGGMTLRAATDFVRGFAQLFDTDRPPVYAQYVVARAAFEAAGVSAWLNEPGVGVPERVKRGLCEQLYSASEVHSLGITDDSQAKVDEWVAVAASFGWKAKRGSSKVEDTRRPPVSDGIRAVSGSGAESRVGDLLYCRTSAVSHVTWFGLQTGLDIAGAEVNRATRTGRVSLGTDSARVGAVMFYMMRTLRAAALARVSLMGWTGPEWEAAVRDELGLEHTVAAEALGGLATEN